MPVLLYMVAMRSRRRASGEATYAYSDLLPEEPPPQPVLVKITIARTSTVERRRARPSKTAILIRGKVFIAFEQIIAAGSLWIAKIAIIVCRFNSLRRLSDLTWLLPHTQAHRILLSLEVW